MKLFGYELLYRRNEVNELTGLMTTRPPPPSYPTPFMGFDELIGGTRGFINSPRTRCSRAALLLPSEKLVVEIERTEITPVLVAACQRLQLGYKLALTISRTMKRTVLAELADIIR